MDKITGIGNALVDSLVHITDDAELERLKLPKGSMQLIDEQQYAALSREMNRLSPKCATGGSAANAMLALARLGRKPGFIGKTGDDEMGRFYAGTMSAAGADIHVAHSSLPTGVASTFISPDGQRTFATFLGAAATLEPADIRPEMIEGSRYLYLEGYLVQNHALIDRAVEIAKQVGAKICLDLASYNIVEQDRAYFERLVSGSVDIVFANAEESRAFTGLEPEAAAERMATMCDTVIVKLGAAGSMARSRSVRGGAARVPAGRVEHVVDTTAAGDFFTAGFMYALTEGCDLETCLRAGTLLSTAVIQVTGTALSDEKWSEIRKETDALCK